jgi:hypothetical protein
MLVQVTPSLIAICEHFHLYPYQARDEELRTALSELEDARRAAQPPPPPPPPSWPAPPPAPPAFGPPAAPPQSHYDRGQELLQHFQNTLIGEGLMAAPASSSRQQHWSRPAPPKTGPVGFNMHIKGFGADTGSGTVASAKAFLCNILDGGQVLALKEDTSASGDEWWFAQMLVPPDHENAPMHLARELKKLGFDAHHMSSSMTWGTGDPDEKEVPPCSWTLCELCTLVWERLLVEQVEEVTTVVTSLWPSVFTKVAGKGGPGSTRHLFMQFEDALTMEVRPSKL